MYLKRNSFVFILILLITSCANIVAPQGGNKDIIPPYALNSTPADSNLNFKSKNITIRFSEPIQLKDPEINIKISPNIKGGIQTEADKNLLIFKLKNLQPNTTYTIYAKNTISDLTEGNTLPVFKYIFSTGDSIDKDRIVGKVIKSSTLDNLPNILVGLYKTLTDTTIKTTTPDYFTYTDDKGFFELENIHKEIYTLIAFEDKNLNKHWDEGEDFAFFNNTIQPDTNSKAIYLRLHSQPISRDYLVSVRSVEKGIYEFEFDPLTPSSIEINQEDSGMYKTKPYYQRNVSNECNPLKLKQYLITGTNPNDSAHFNYSVNNTLYHTAVKVSKDQAVLKPVNLFYTFYTGNEIKIPFLRLLDTNTIIHSKITLFEDTLPIKPSAVLPDYKTGLKIKHLKKGRYHILFEKNAITDLTGISNDSFQVIINVLDKDDVQSIILNTDSTFNSIYELRITNAENYCYQQSLYSNQKITIENLLPGKYQISVIDLYKETLTETGRILNKATAEKVVYYKEIEVKPNFDIEEKLSILYH